MRWEYLDINIKRKRSTRKYIIGNNPNEIAISLWMGCYIVFLESWFSNCECRVPTGIF